MCQRKLISPPLRTTSAGLKEKGWSQWIEQRAQ
uniref:Uncharacterized protein n=1 Tax=Anguilla anguilla TaxID=7936 RepID=A0A0E9QDI8_ANGAN